MALWQQFLDVLETRGLTFEQVRQSDKRAIFTLTGFTDPSDVAVLETEWAQRVDSEPNHAVADAPEGDVAATITKLRIDDAAIVSSHRSTHFRLVDKLGYVGNCPDEYFKFCRELDNHRGSADGALAQKEFTPLLCTIGVGGQGKTELCHEILRQIEATGAPNVCAVMVTFNQGFDWKQSDYKQWDTDGAIRGLWARIGVRMSIPNWEVFKPDTVVEIFDMLHAIVKQRCGDATETEVHLLVDETLKIEDDAERGKLLDGIGVAIQLSINKRTNQKSYALVTSLRAKPIKDGVALSGSNRKLQYLPLGTPTSVRRKIAMSLLLHVFFGILETLVAERIPDVDAICAKIQEDPRSWGDPQPGSPLRVNKNAVVSGALAGLAHSGAVKATPDWLPGIAFALFDRVKLSVCHAVYGSGTWRSMEELFIRRDSYLRSFYHITEEHQVVVAPTIPGLLHRAAALYTEGPNVAKELKACVLQLMKLTEGWVTITSNKFEDSHFPFVLQEGSVSELLIRGTMWIYWRDTGDSLRTIPFVSLPFLSIAEDQSELHRAERSFHSTYKELAKALMVPTFNELPRAFERAVILAMGLRLQALKWDSPPSTHQLSATLEDLLPFAIFSSDSTKELRLRQPVHDHALAMPTLEDVLGRNTSTEDTAMELMKLPHDPNVLCVTEGKTSAKAIGGVMWFEDDDGQSVLCIYSMKLRQGVHAANAFKAVFELLASSTIAIPDRICVMVASAEDLDSFAFPTPPRSSSGIECVLLSNSALGVLLGPFGASFLRVMVDEKSSAAGGKQ